MATTNLALAKHTDGRPVAEVDIAIGLTVVAPSWTGGVLEYKCVSRDADKAEFKSLNKDWPIGFEMQFNQPDFTLDDFAALSEALKNFDKLGATVTSEQRQLVHRAHELGYAHQRSYTQANWTEKGAEAFATLRDNAEPIQVNGYKIQYNPFWGKWQMWHEEIGFCGEYGTSGEAVEDAKKG